jgi:flagellar basal-body rod protein FlgF
VNYGLWMSAAGLATEVHRQDVIANNVANADTVAFKPDLSYTRERPVAREELGATTPAKFLLERLGGGVLAADTITDFAQGDLRQTGGPLDVAIEGEGFFAVADADGERFTRDGRFQRDDRGRLVDLDGRPVLSDRGRHITLGEGPVVISANGAVSVAGSKVARLRLVAPPTDALLKQGDNLYRLADGAATPKTANATVKHGFVEGSGVNPITSLADLVESGRSVQAAARFIDLHDRMMELAVNRISATG